MVNPSSASVTTVPEAPPAKASSPLTPYPLNQEEWSEGGVGDGESEGEEDSFTEPNPLAKPKQQSADAVVRSMIPRVLKTSSLTMPADPDRSLFEQDHPSVQKAVKTETVIPPYPAVVQLFEATGPNPHDYRAYLKKNQPVSLRVKTLSHQDRPPPRPEPAIIPLLTVKGKIKGGDKPEFPEATGKTMEKHMVDAWHASIRMAGCVSSMGLFANHLAGLVDVKSKFHKEALQGADIDAGELFTALFNADDSVFGLLDEIKGIATSILAYVKTAALEAAAASSCVTLARRALWLQLSTFTPEMREAIMKAPITSTGGLFAMSKEKLAEIKKAHEEAATAVKELAQNPTAVMPAPASATRPPRRGRSNRANSESYANWYGAYKDELPKHQPYYRGRGGRGRGNFHRSSSSENSQRGSGPKNAKKDSDVGSSREGNFTK